MSHDASTGTPARHPYFTVIIPTYNRPELLAEAVASVQGQTCTDWELIIADDCSPQPVQPWPDPRVSVIRNDTNRGKSHALNVALQRAAGEVVLFLDDDDAWGPHRLDHAWKAHKLAPVAVCGGATMAAGGVRTDQSDDRDEVPISVVPWTWRTHIPSGGALSVERSLCPDFDVALRACEDVDWVMRLRLRAPFIAVIDGVDFIWRVHSGPRHLNGLPARIEGRLQVLDKHEEYLAANPAERAVHLRQLGYLHLRSGTRLRALALAARSLSTRPTAGAVKLGLRALLPTRAARRSAGSADEGA